MLYIKIFELIFPNVCGFCGEKINERYTCRKCLNILEYYKEKVYFSSNFGEYLDGILCAFNYKGILKEKMLQLKFHNNKYISKTFGEILSYKITKYNLGADIIVPVPICRKRYFERGYNQSEYIAKYVSKFCDIKLEKNILKKVKNNKRQSLLDATERKLNVKDVYAIKEKANVKGKNILLLDDIYTTGATLNECAKMLKLAGANKIIGITVLYSEK